MRVAAALPPDFVALSCPQRGGVLVSEDLRSAAGSSHLPSIFLILGAAVVSLGDVRSACAESYRSDHFAVEAPSKPVARQVAQAAESARRRIVAQWLGKKPCEWAELCTIHVELSAERHYGATRFAYANDTWSGAQIFLRGPLDQLLTRVLPHEVTHAVLMLHFGRPIPRWADEGAAILAEEPGKLHEYDRLVLKVAERDRAYALEYLLTSREYPAELDVFYPQSYSVTRFLIGLRGRKTFLAFLAHGMDTNWDEAVQAHYGYDDIRDLERAWQKHLKVVEARVRARELAVRLGAELPAFAASNWVTQSWATFSKAITARNERVIAAVPPPN
jgi:hypothetical protein